MDTAIQDPHLAIDDDATARIEQARYEVIHLAGEAQALRPVDPRRDPAQAPRPPARTAPCGPDRSPR